MPVILTGMVHKQRGNILFLILLAIILFAALSFVVTNDQRGQDKNASSERVRTLAAQMVENASLMENTMQRAMLVNNIPEYGFNFSGEQSNSNTNYTCTSTACQIFTTNGGPVPPLRLPDWASADTTMTDSRRKVWIQLWSVVGVGTDAPDLLVDYGFVTQELCKAINVAVGAENFNIVSTDAFQPGELQYSGTITAIPAATAVIGETLPAIIGRRSLCINTGSKGYNFYHVILAR